MIILLGYTCLVEDWQDSNKFRIESILPSAEKKKLGKVKREMDKNKKNLSHFLDIFNHFSKVSNIYFLSLVSIVGESVTNFTARILLMFGHLVWGADWVESISAALQK